MALPHRLYETMRYLVAGGIGVSLYYLLLYTLTEYADWWYLLSAAIGSIANFTSNFLLQKFWTFRNKDRNTVRAQARKYAILYVSLFVANLALMFVLVTLMHIWYILAQIPVTIILSAVSYLISRKIFSISIHNDPVSIDKSVKI
ncbi:MAG: GtrA family protein [Patescibacteria group bacterium]